MLPSWNQKPPALLLPLPKYSHEVVSSRIVISLLSLEK